MTGSPNVLKCIQQYYEQGLQNKTNEHQTLQNKSHLSSLPY
ncbi:hypothetical protein [Priestia megaterium]|nr:hypothetical protein [Priestia megaterium]